MSPDDDHTKLCLACLAALEGVGPVSIRRLWEAARGGPDGLQELMGLSAAELESEFGLPRSAARAIHSVRNPLERGRAVGRQLAAAGARAVFEGDLGYPDRLRDFLREEAPPVLFVRGDLSVLQSSTVSMVGSRRPSQTASEAAEYLAGRLAEQDRTVVSGGAKGIDTISQSAALRTGAACVAPATGILRFRPRGVPRDADGRCCVLGHFAPDARWRTGQAMARNRIIVALGEAVVAFEPRDRGGTWHSSMTALRLGVPLFVVCGSDAASKRRGLRRLVNSGATPLDPERMPDAREFAEMVAQQGPPDRQSQRRLFESSGDWQ